MKTKEFDNTRFSIGMSCYYKPRWSSAVETHSIMAVDFEERLVQFENETWARCERITLIKKGDNR